MTTDKEGYQILGQQFSITRRIEIDAAHRVPHHGSKCYAVHGHRYIIEATCIGDLVGKGEQTGMVMDFGFLKACMIDVIHNPCDHGIILWTEDEILDQANIGQGAGWWKVYTMNKVPTAENLAEEWYHALRMRIEEFFLIRPESAPGLASIDVWETPNCRARFPV